MANLPLALFREAHGFYLSLIRSIIPVKNVSIVPMIFVLVPFRGCFTKPRPGPSKTLSFLSKLMWVVSFFIKNPSHGLRPRHNQL